MADLVGKVGKVATTLIFEIQTPLESLLAEIRAMLARLVPSRAKTDPVVEAAKGE